PDPFEDLRRFIEPVGREEHRHRATDGFVCGVPVHPLRGRIPVRDRALEGLADDCVRGGLDDRGQTLSRRSPGSVVLVAGHCHLSAVFVLHPHSKPEVSSCQETDYASSSSRILWASRSAPNGFCRNAVPGPIPPLETTASSV